MGTPDQAGLRINRFVGTTAVSEPGFGAKEPPLGTPDQAGLGIKSFGGMRVVSVPNFGAKESPLGTTEYDVSNGWHLVIE